MPEGNFMLVSRLTNRRYPLASRILSAPSTTTVPASNARALVRSRWYARCAAAPELTPVSAANAAELAHSTCLRDVAQPAKELASIGAGPAENVMRLVSSEAHWLFRAGGAMVQVTIHQTAKSVMDQVSSKFHAQSAAVQAGISLGVSWDKIIRPPTSLLPTHSFPPIRTHPLDSRLGIRPISI